MMQKKWLISTLTITIQEEINEAFWFVIKKELTESQSNEQSERLKRFEL